MSNIVKMKPRVRCARMGCMTWVFKHTEKKRILCKKCWHKMIEEAALSQPSLMHIAHSDGPHEFVVTDHLQEFIEWFDIERPEGK